MSEQLSRRCPARRRIRARGHGGVREEGRRHQGRWSTRPTTQAQTQRAVDGDGADRCCSTGIEERITFATVPGRAADAWCATGRRGPRRVPEARHRRCSPNRCWRSASPRASNERPYYVVHHTFDVAGNWGVRRDGRGQEAGRRGDRHQRSERGGVARPRQGAAEGSDADDRRRAWASNPICTRADGMCPFHAASLDARRRQRQAHDRVAGDARAVPVGDVRSGARHPHCRNPKRCATGSTSCTSRCSPTTPARRSSPAFAAFKTQSEPVMYLADKNGTSPSASTDRSTAPKRVKRSADYSADYYLTSWKVFGMLSNMESDPKTDLRRR